MKRIVLLAVLALLPVLAGCRAIAAAGDVARQYDDLKPKIEAGIEAGKQAVEIGQKALIVAQETAAEVKQIEAKARADADTNGNSKLDPNEWLNYASLLALGLSEYARRKANATQKETDELWVATHKPIAEAPAKPE